MKKFSLILILIFCVIILGAVEKATAADKINWTAYYKEGMREAQITKTPVMIYFYQDWSGECRKMEKETFTDSNVVGMSQHFICIKLDKDRYRDLTEKYSIIYYPAVLFLNSMGFYLHSISGFLPATDFVEEMEKAVKKLK